MPRPKIQTPGNAAPPMDEFGREIRGDDDHQQESSSADAIVDDGRGTGRSYRPWSAQPSSDDTPLSAEEQLRSENEQLKRQIAALSQVGNAQPNQLGFYTPDTPHGVAAKRASKHLHMTSDELHSAILAGTEPEPKEMVLTSTGWYVPRTLGGNR